MRRAPAERLEYVVPVLGVVHGRARPPRRRRAARGPTRFVRPLALPAAVLVLGVLSGCGRNAEPPTGPPAPSRAGVVAEPEPDTVLLLTPDGVERVVPASVDACALLGHADFMSPPGRIALTGHLGWGLGQPGIGDRLVALDDDRLPEPGTELRDLTVVRSPADLVGRVSIDSPQKALAYVRLFTSPETAHCFDEWWYELMPLSVLRSDAGFGTDLRRFSLARGGGERGVLTDEECRDSGLPGPQVKPRPDGSWEVSRWLYPSCTTSEYVPGRNLVIRVRERVWPDGRTERDVGERLEIPHLCRAVLGPRHLLM